MDIYINTEIKVKEPLNQIFLIGMMGVGKSKIGTKLASHLSWEFADVDQEIESSMKLSIREIFEKHGESGFREKESEWLEQHKRDKQIVIATGGGLPCFNDNIDKMLPSGLCIWLTGSAAFIASRLLQNKEDRPMLDQYRSRTDLVFGLESLLNDRIEHYSKAHWHVDAMKCSPTELSLEIQRLL